MSGGGDHIGAGSTVHAAAAATQVDERRSASDDDAAADDAPIVPGPRAGQVMPALAAPHVPLARPGGAGESAGPPASSVGDPEFREYVQKRSRALLRTAYMLTGNRADAEDLVQSALAKTYRAWDRIEDRAALDGYVRRAMVNTHISWWRRRRVEEFPMDELPDQAIVDHDIGSDIEETLRRAVDRLPQRMRAAIMLRYFDDMTEAEVAEVLGVTLGTVKSTVARAMAKLRIDAELQPG